MRLYESSLLSYSLVLLVFQQSVTARPVPRSEPPVPKLEAARDVLSKGTANFMDLESASASTFNGFQPCFSVTVGAGSARVQYAV
ncbi:hypothetical protein TWF506_010759 [Arthrobotrys conoides]|uniref:Uncharacterized protein n=1 Tax=Arthrobotrys conoides TaxID=74498 RepID=A0AAN8RW63_9PEZI